MEEEEGGGRRRRRTGCAIQNENPHCGAWWEKKLSGNHINFLISEPRKNDFVLEGLQK
jgi:hypothetical protein